jgi:hypothetical protein
VAAEPEADPTAGCTGSTLAANQARDPRLPPPGTTIKKEYRGETYEVLVLAAGFEFRGERFNSLSRLARTIAGTPWNGFIFFDLVNGHEAE